ncbi:hypothetical protein AC578_3094 [Pseudocercospora eumusae]|uniref:Uncharacterized protein n=1 Tax=Pseudocercospora eumusae TaxID=321146 RepID=A0A139H1Q8_9PEZI|nr:hypothetical protein AC578_3094 [Pseudocercospora eumusae]
MRRSELPSEIAYQQRMSQAQQPHSLRRVSARADLRVAFKQGRQDAARRVRQLYWRGSGLQHPRAESGSCSTSTSSSSSATSSTVSDTTDATLDADSRVPAAPSHNIRAYADLSGAPRPDADIIEQISQEPWLTSGYPNLQLVTSAAHQAQQRRHRAADAIRPAQSIETDIDHFCHTVHGPTDGVRQQIADHGIQQERKRKWRIFR